MIISFERSGGFAGMIQRVDVDTDDLDASVQQELADLVAAADFFEIPLAQASPAGADRFNYVLTIESGDLSRTVTMSEAEIPDAWQPLIQRLNLLVREQRGR
ncbi:MAG: protealysin inhibitor emfourin [Anaerolineales bacterium]|jgi:hypothetical protein